MGEISFHCKANFPKSLLMCFIFLTVYDNMEHF